MIQVGTDDARVQRTALGNAGTCAAHDKARGEPFAIEAVAFGPGDAIAFAARRNSRRGIADAQGKTPEEIPQLPGGADTPSGIVRVAALRERGWSCVRP